MKHFDIIEFEWYENNQHKSLKKHGITNMEAEDAFFDPNGKLYKDIFIWEFQAVGNTYFKYLNLKTKIKSE